MNLITCFHVTLIAISMQILQAIGLGFPLIGKPSYPSYTSEMIQDVFDSQSASLKLSEVDPLYKIIEMLTQVSIQQQKRLDILDQSQTSLRTELTDLAMKFTQFHQLMKNKMSLYHHDNLEPTMYNTLRGGWDLPNTASTTQNKPAMQYIDEFRTINNSLTALSLKIDTLDYHLEEVEEVVYAVKADTTDDFASIINSVIPVLESSVEQKFMDNLNDHITSLIGGPAVKGDLNNNHISTGCLPNNGSKIQLTHNKPSSGLSGKTNETPEDSGATWTHEDQGRQLSNKTFLEGWYRDTCTRKKLTGLRDYYKVQQINGGRNKVIGAWMMDSQSKSSDIFMMQGYRKLTRLLQFSNVIDFSKGVIDKVYELPFRCGGTGHVVFNNSFYCHGFKSARVFKYDLQTRIANETRLPGRGIHGEYEYSIHGFNEVDFMSDRSSLWLVYSTRNSSGNMILAKIKPENLEFEFMENINANITEAMNSFMICGEMYTLNKDVGLESFTLTKVWSVYGSHATRAEAGIGRKYATMKIVGETGGHMIMMADFNPRDHRLYTWNFQGIGKAALYWYEFYFD